MRGRIEDSGKRAAANRSRSEKQRAYWASAEGHKVKDRMAKERRGKQTEAHKRAMADPEVQRRRIDGYRRMLGVVPVEEEPDGPGVVTDEERQVAATEGEPAP